MGQSPNDTIVFGIQFLELQQLRPDRPRRVEGSIVASDGKFALDY